MADNIIRNVEGKLMLSPSVYKIGKNGAPTDSNIDVFSLIGALSENADLFLEKDNKKRYKAMLRYMYTQSEINGILAKNKVKNLDALIDHVQKYKGTVNYPAELAPVIQNLNEMQEYLNTVITNKELSANLLPPGRAHSENLRLLQSGSLGLVKNILHLNNSSNFADIKVFKSKLTTIEKSDKISEAKAIQIYNNTLAHVKKVYGYNVVGTSLPMEAERLSGNKLVCHLDKNKLFSSVNILYNTAKQLKGSKNISFNTAKQYVYTNDKTELKMLEHEFNAKKENISEVVSVISTLFISRFILDKDAYFDVNKQLSIQLAYKLRTLIFSTDGVKAEDPSVKDAWLIKFIQNRVMQNVTEVVTKNGINSAQQLAKIYAANGTTFENASDILNIEDLVFATQKNSQELQKVQTLSHAAVNNTFGTIKKKDALLKRVKSDAVKNLLKQPKYYEIYENAYNKKYNEVLNILLTQKKELDSLEFENRLENVKDSNGITQEEINEKSSQKLTTEQAVELVKTQAEVNASEDATETIENIINEEKVNSQTVEDDETLNLIPNIQEEQPKVVENETATEQAVASNDLNAVVVEEKEQENLKEENLAKAENVEKAVEEEKVENVEKVEENTENKEKQIFHTEEEPKSPEELFNEFKKIYKQILKGKNIVETLNLRMRDNKRIQNNKQNTAAKKTREFMTEQIATVLAEKTFVYYAKAKKSKNIEISSRPRAIISCYCNEELLGKSIFYSEWRSQTNKWLGVLLASECNKLLNEFNLEYAVDEKTFAKITAKESFKNFEKELQNYRETMKKTETSVEEAELEK